MTLWYPVKQSNLRIWSALARYNYGVEHFDDGTAWVLQVYRLEKRRGEYLKVRVADFRSDDEINVVLQALSVLPGIGIRIRLMEALL